MQEAVDAAATPAAKAAAQAEYDKQAALLQKRNKAYNEFCEQNGLTKRNDRISIALWDRKQAARARGAVRIKAKISAKKPKDYGVFKTWNITKADSVRPKSIIKNLRKTDIGNKIMEYLAEEGVPVYLCYGMDNPGGFAGVYDPIDDIIYVYGDVTRSTMETAKTVIHEARHRQLGCTHSLDEEFECFKAEMLHEKGSLTKEDEESIIKHILKHYPDLR